MSMLAMNARDHRQELSADHEHVARGIVFDALDASIRATVRIEHGAADEIDIEVLARLDIERLSWREKRRADEPLRCSGVLRLLERNQQSPLVLPHALERDHFAVA